MFIWESSSLGKLKLKILMETENKETSGRRQKTKTQKEIK